MSRQEQISNLQSYLKEVDKDLTMILQNLQWDRSLLSTEQASLSKCKYNDDHKVSNSKLREHEEMCLLKQNGYSSEDVFLPELLDTDGPTVVKFNSNAIKDIIDNAAKKDPLFKRGCNSEDILPLTTERLQSTYTADERRAIHDAVVSSMRTQSENIDEFVIPSGGSGAADSDKSWLERLAEKRDGRRRRTKYRAPPKTRNYSLVLRDVISTQMELLNEMSGNAEADQSNSQEEDGVDIKKETDESSQYESTSNTKRDVNAHKSRHYSEKYSHYNERRHNRHEDTESRRYYDKYGKDKYHEDTEYKRYHERHIKDKKNEYEYRENNDNRSKDKYNEDAESKRRYYDNYKPQEPRNYKKSEEKISKSDTNVEDANSYYSRHTEYSRRERDRSTRESSKDKSKYKKYRDDKRYDSKDESTKYDKRKRQRDDEKYEGYTEREEYNSSDRKREKYDERQEREKDRRYGKSKSDYKHKKHY